MPVLVLFVSGAPVITVILNWVHEFRFLRPWLAPSISQFDLATAKRLAGLGLRFAVLQLAALLSLSLDNIVTAQLLGAAAVTQLSITQRAYMAIPAIAGAWLAPLWPAYCEAAGRGDIGWIKSTLRRSVIFFPLFSAAMSIILLVFGKVIFSRWAGPQYVPNLSLSVGSAVWATLFTFSGAIATYFCGRNLIAIQIQSAVAMGVLGLILKLFLQHSMGLAGIVWSNVIVYSVIIMPISLIYLRRDLSGFPRTPAAGVSRVYA